MKRFIKWLEGPQVRVATAVGALALMSSGCEKPAEAREAAVVEQAQLGEALEKVAEECGLDINCQGGGILDGNASVSGVASVDTFFGSVINFGVKAEGVSGAINAELDAIRADFGIAADADLAAGIQAQVQANVQGSLKVEAEPARCSADVSATLEAQARCDAEFTPGSAMVECHGSCEVDASAEVSCDASATLECTIIPPGGSCEGSCSGTCEAGRSLSDRGRAQARAAALSRQRCLGPALPACRGYRDRRTGRSG